MFFFLSPGLGSWQLEFKSLITLFVGFKNFFCCLAGAVDLGVQTTDEGRSLYNGSFCPAMKSLSRYLEEATFSISISSSISTFFYCFHFMSFFKDMFRELGFAFCVPEMFPVFFKSCVKVSVGSSYIKFVAVGACLLINPLPVVFVELLYFIWYYIIQFVICFVGYL